MGSDLDFSSPDTSFSPMFSNVGLCIGDEGGIEGVFLHYNRVTTKFFCPLLRVPGEIKAHEKNAFDIKQSYDHGNIQVAFYDRNSWLLDYRGSEAIQFKLNNGDGLYCGKRGEP